jgi:hypothetical protein
MLREKVLALQFLDVYLIALQEANLSVGQEEIETGDAKFTRTTTLSYIMLLPQQ